MNSLESRLGEAWAPHSWQDVTVLLAVSGGVDSTALLRAMAALKTEGPGRLAVAHFNHGLRGQESQTDETFVVALCRELGVPCELGRAEEGRLASECRDGLESAAREARYDFLQRTADRLGARYLVTAHTADDQAETILHRILRGTGVAGLSGIARVRPLGPATTLIRPLLAFRRAELEAYLENLGQPYRDDASNQNVRFTRNRIRHELLPSLAAQYNPGVVDALLRLGALAGEAQSVIDAIVGSLKDDAVEEGPSGGLRIDTTELIGQPRYIVRELLMAAWRTRDWPMQAMGYLQWDLLAEMAVAIALGRSPASSKQTLPGNILAECIDDSLWLRRVA